MLFFFSSSTLSHCFRGGFDWEQVSTITTRGQCNSERERESWEKTNETSPLSAQFYVVRTSIFTHPLAQGKASEPRESFTSIVRATTPTSGKKHKLCSKLFCLPPPPLAAAVDFTLILDIISIHFHSSANRTIKLLTRCSSRYFDNFLLSFSAVLSFRPSGRVSTVKQQFLTHDKAASKKNYSSRQSRWKAAEKWKIEKLKTFRRRQSSRREKREILRLLIYSRGSHRKFSSFPFRPSWVHPRAHKKATFNIQMDFLELQRG